MTVAVESGTKAGIKAEDFQNISIQQEVDVAAVLGLDLREATREILVQKTLKLTDTISELVEKGNVGSPDCFREAAEVVEQKNQIAGILHGHSVATSSFARRTGEDEFSFLSARPDSRSNPGSLHS